MFKIKINRKAGTIEKYVGDYFVYRGKNLVFKVVRNYKDKILYCFVDNLGKIRQTDISLSYYERQLSEDIYIPVPEREAPELLKNTNFNHV